MNLILHHLAKDIRAQRWLLLLWAAVLLSGIILDLLILQPDYMFAERIEAFRSSPLLPIICVIVWTLILARLIQSEPVTGSTSFWLTRPVPPRVYLLSKIAFILVFLFLPAFVPTFIHSWQFQSDEESINRNLLTLLAIQTFAAICVIWLATYTPTTLHFAGVLCISLMTYLFMTLLNFQLRRPIHPSLDSTTDTSLGTTWFVSILLCGLLLSLIVQLVIRRARVGFWLGIAAVIIAIVGQLVIPNRVSPADTGPFQLSSQNVGPKVDFPPDWQKTLQWSRGNNPFRVTANLVPLVDGKPDHAAIDSVESEFQAPGEKPITITHEESRAWRWQWTLPWDRLRELLPGINIAADNHLWDYRPPVPLFIFNAVPSNPLYGKAGTLILNIDGGMVSLEQKAKLPLDQPDFINRIPGGFIRLEPVHSQKADSLTVWRLSPQMPGNGLGSRGTIYVLVDPEAHTGTILSEGGDSSMSGRFPATEWDSHTTFNLKGDESLGHAVLYVFEYKLGDAFHQTLTLPNFTLKPQ